VQLTTNSLEVATCSRCGFYRLQDQVAMQTANRMQAQQLHVALVKHHSQTADRLLSGALT
jgi:hypothetical protein